jgi:hypothetical protein
LQRNSPKFQVFDDRLRRDQAPEPGRSPSLDLPTIPMGEQSIALLAADHV